MANTAKEVTKAMTGLWKSTVDTNPDFIRNNGLYPGIAPQNIFPLFATWNIVPPGKLIMTMGQQGLQGYQGTNIDDMQIQVSYFADQKQGMAMALDLSNYGDSLWHRQPLSIANGVNLVGMYRIGTYVDYWIDAEKLWTVVKTYRIMAG